MVKFLIEEGKILINNTFLISVKKIANFYLQLLVKSIASAFAISHEISLLEFVTRSTDPNIYSARVSRS